MTRSLVINTASHAVPIRREFRMAELTDRFGTMVFSEEVMKDYLPKDIWKRLAQPSRTVSRSIWMWPTPLPTP